MEARLTQIADGVWRGAHPERADTLGGHGGPPIHARLADALMALVRGESGAGVGSRPSVVVTVNAETLGADITGSGPGSGPLSVADVAGLAARADVYGAVLGASGVVLSFGRSRRLASSLQRLAVIVRDGRRCVVEGCDVSHDRCDVHHVVEFEHGVATDLANLALVCGAHRTYLHTNRLRLIRDGTRWRVGAEDVSEVQWADTG